MGTGVRPLNLQGVSTGGAGAIGVFLAENESAGTPRIVALFFPTLTGYGASGFL